MKSTFSQRLQEIMDIKSVKQSDIVKKTGIPKSAISQYLSGKFEAKQDRVYLLAKMFNVSEAWLMGYDVPMGSTFAPSELSAREETLVANYRQLNEDGKDKADEYIEDLLGMKRVYRAARSADNHPAEITVLTKEEQERIEKAPRVTSENSDL